MIYNLDIQYLSINLQKNTNMNTKVNCKVKWNKMIFQSQENVSIGKLIIYQMHKTIQQFFPDIFERMSQFSDYIERKQYELAN